MKCPNGACVLDLSECTQDPNPDPSRNPDPDPNLDPNIDQNPDPNPGQDNPCLNSPDTHWRCKNGNCLLKSSVCDGSYDCSSDGSDNSDEESGDGQGCNLYPG